MHLSDILDLLLDPRLALSLDAGLGFLDLPLFLDQHLRRLLFPTRMALGLPVQQGETKGGETLVQLPSPIPGKESPGARFQQQPMFHLLLLSQRLYLHHRQI